MIVFSMLSTQASRMFQLNSQNMIQSEIEYNAVALGQDYLEQIRWINNQAQFDIFMSQFPREDLIVLGDSDEYEMPYQVAIETQDIVLEGSNNTSNKIVTVTIENEYLKQNPLDLDSDRKKIKVQGIKSFN